MNNTNPTKQPRIPGRIAISCSTSGTRCCTVKPHERLAIWNSCSTALHGNKIKQYKLNMTPIKQQLQINAREYRAMQKDNPEKLGTYGTQDEDKQNTTQYVLDTTRRKQTQITSTRHEPSYKQLEV